MVGLDHAAALAVRFSLVGDRRLDPAVGNSPSHQPRVVYAAMDFAYAAYMVIMGALIELRRCVDRAMELPGQSAGRVPRGSSPCGESRLFTCRLLLPLVRQGAGSAVPG